MKKTLTLLTLLLAFLPSVVTAQAAKAAAEPSVVLAFCEDLDLTTITKKDGTALTPVEGMTIPIGTTIVTPKGASAELQLIPNKTIIHVSASTTFKLKALKGIDGSQSNDFELAAGKIRAVAAKVSGSKDPLYNVSTKTANCGVRGTDFAMKFDAEAQLDWVCVQEGEVGFTSIATGEVVSVATGQFANTFDPVFQSAPVGADRLAELFADVAFVKLNPLDVPGKDVASTTEEKSAETTAAAAGTGTEVPAADAAEEVPAPAADDPMTEALKKLFGLEVGSITIRGVTYSKAVMSPVIGAAGFKLGLYLPIVYTSDMFNPKDWYHPEGNDEWSFGADKKGLWNKTTDIISDTVLKIKFLEIGTQGMDPFYLKLGNLKTMSLGHGTIVSNFANDQEFPAVRKVGLNAGVKLGPIALEGMSDDVAKASVVGGRFAIDLIGDQIAVGATTAADLSLANNPDLVSDPVFAGQNDLTFGKPVLLVGGADLQLFKINAGVFSALAFADVNTMAVYFQKSPTLETQAGYDELSQGLNLTPFFHDGAFGSFGGESGLYGKILMVDYRLTYQVEKGLYTNGIFQGNYYRSRNALLKSVVDYTTSVDIRSKVDETLNMGVFGSFGFDIGLLSLEGAYRWPFELKADGSVGPSDADSLKIKVNIPKDKIPFVALSGGISYERTGFVPSLRDGVDLFDANTVFKGEVIYGLAKGMDLVVGLGTSTMRDESGAVLFEKGKPKVGPTVSIDTRVSL